MENHALVSATRFPLGVRRRLAIVATTNPQQIILPQDEPGRIVNCRIKSFYLSPIGGAMSHYNLEMGDAIHGEFIGGFGVRAGCICTFGGTLFVDFPIRFKSDKIPQNFRLAVYGPGEAGALVTLAVNSHIVILMEYDFIPE